MKTLVHTDQATIEEAIRQCQVCSVGMVDTDGTPYVIPMSFGYEENIVYLHSGQEGRSISILEKNPNVCLSFCTDPKIVFQHPQVACSYSAHSKSVIGWGRVVFEEDYDEKVKALNLIMQQYSDKTFEFNRPAVLNVKIWKVELQKVTCKEFGTSPHKN